uniref:HAT C-terminal dimerisation domain-containing protein n=1 Tax=Quercus lobata TaxID=97700 RepID=A0A7N2KMJ8_QUELO
MGEDGRASTYSCICADKRRKPHADLDVLKVYLDAVDRLAIKDRERMSALSWWDLYGVSAPELCSLAIKVLSQSVKSTCTGGALITFEYIRNVKRNLMNADMEAVEDTQSMLCFVLMTSTLQKVARHLLRLVKIHFKEQSGALSKLIIIAHLLIMQCLL